VVKPRMSHGHEHGGKESTTEELYRDPPLSLASMVGLDIAEIRSISYPRGSHATGKVHEPLQQKQQ
jgi:hypothetical protein